MISSTRAIDWPHPDSVKIGPKGYTTPDGTFARVTSILKVLGLGTEGLIKWSANEERKACLEAARETYAQWWSLGDNRGHAAFVEEIEKRIGPARQHQKQLAKAAEIGTAAHAAIHSFLKGEDAVPLCDEAQWAVMAFDEWWTGTKLKAIRMEQPVWDARLGYAGTIDLIAEHPRLGLGLVDFKTSKSVYDSHHLQVAAYMHAAENWTDLRWAQIVRLPKNVDDPKFEMVPLGKLYDRTLEREDLMNVFKAALVTHNTLVAK